MLLPALPVPILIVFALLPVATLTVPVVPESIVKAPALVIVPFPANPNAVAETEMVSSEETEESAPLLITMPLMVLEVVGALIALPTVSVPPIVVLPVVERLPFSSIVKSLFQQI